MEAKNEFFIIEKSLDGQNFEDLMEVESRSNSTSPKYYLDNDFAPQIGMNFYRLRQVLKDGTELYSPIYEVEFNLNLEELVVFPNPAKDKVFINLKNFIGKNTTVQMYDARGVLQIERSINEIENTLLEIDVANYNNGFYMISIDIEGQKRMVEKIVIENGK